MEQTEIIIVSIVFGLFFILFMAAIGVYFWQYHAKRKEFNLRMQAQETEFRNQLLNTQLEVQQQTMAQIGREIHDNVGQLLTLACIYMNQELDAAKKEVPLINKIQPLINQSLADLRQLSITLSDPNLEKHSFYELLAQIAEKIGGVVGFELQSDDWSKEVQLTAVTKIVLYRMVQEFVQNSLKHAQCTQLLIRLFSTRNQLNIALSDNGKGFDLGIQSAGSGIKNLHTRAQLIGAKIDLHSSGQGTALEIHLPIGEMELSMND